MFSCFTSDHVIGQIAGTVSYPKVHMVDGARKLRQSGKTDETLLLTNVLPKLLRQSLENMSMSC
eukprot:1869466-Amphidinium_carterae.2